jgi:predicted P-loop ATPase
VFFGTTNDSEFLKDRTGNRRFWPVKVGLLPAAKSIFNGLELEVDQIYAEAFIRWQLGEPLYLTGEADEIAKEQQEEHRESNVKEGIIKEFISRRVPLNWDQKDISDRRLYWSGEFGKVEGETVIRDRICAAEIWVECFHTDIKFMKKVDTRELNDILSSFPGWESYRGRFGPYGHQRGFKRTI